MKIPLNKYFILNNEIAYISLITENNLFDGSKEFSCRHSKFQLTSCKAILL